MGCETESAVRNCVHVHIAANYDLPFFIATPQWILIMRRLGIQSCLMKRFVFLIGRWTLRQISFFVTGADPDVDLNCNLSCLTSF
jgi:hypothetical protein